MPSVISRDSITESYTRFDSFNQESKNETIDLFLENQPDFGIIFSAVDQVLLDEECEPLIQMGCIIWMAFKKQFPGLRRVKKGKIKKILRNNLYMKELCDAEEDVDTFFEKALKKYPEHEVLSFVHSGLHGRWHNVLCDPGSMNVLFYTLKTIIDCLVVARTEK